MGYVKKGWTKFLKRGIACLVSATMLANLWICPVGAQENTMSGEKETEIVLVEQTEEFIELGEAETSAQPIGFFSLADGNVELKSGNYKDWIDRLDLSEAQVIKDFYDKLVEASDNDGENDLLIEDVYFNNAEGNRILVDMVSVPLTQEQVDNKEYNEILSEISSRYAKYIWAAYAAFDRDCPEVFWLSGQCSMSCPASIYGNSSGYTMDASVYFVAKSNSNDIRSTKYPNQAAIEAAIAQRDSMVDEYLTAVATKNDYEKLVYFNEKLTKTNEYNTSDDLNNIDHDSRECMSALDGRTGTVGPVCEAYARALKVLCDRSNIDCVLVDGTAISNSGSGPHMWNYVKLNEKWYGVDVTWNDPSGGVSGAVSGVEGIKWLLVGSETVINSRSFLASHPVSNMVFSDSVAFTNGPVLNSTAYEASEKIYVTPTFSSSPTLNGVYGQTVSEMAISGATTSTNGVTGTWALSSLETGGSDVPEVGTVDTYSLTFTPDDTETYKTVSMEVIPQVSPKPITVTVSNKSKKYGEENPVFGLSVTSGELVGTDSLGDFKITYSCAATDNSAPGSYAITATVTNANYDVTVVPGQLTINKADMPKNAPKSSYAVANIVKKVSEVSLPENWAWSDEDSSKTLPAGSMLEVTAEYAGDDAACYMNTAMTITITRAACESGEVVYTGDGEKAPTCTEDGIGHKECKFCGEMMEENVVVPATNHVGTQEIRNAKDATCEDTGYTGDVYCSACGELLKAGTVISKTTKHTCGRETSENKTLPVVGTWLPDPKGEASYKVSEVGKEAEYTGPVNKKAKKVVIPPTITVNGVTYEVTSIAANAFKGNKKLTNVTIGNNIVSVGDKAFYKCTALKKITIPSGVSKIGKQAFSGCKKLKTITIKSATLTSENVGSKAFKGIHSKAKFKVPKAKLKEYKKLLKKKGATKKHKITK